MRKAARIETSDEVEEPVAVRRLSDLQKAKRRPQCLQK